MNTKNLRVAENARGNC